MEQANHPKKVWVMNRDRVRKGLGPHPIDRLEPIYVTLAGERMLDAYYGRPAGRSGRLSLYRVEDCYLTEADAKAEGARLAHEEIAHVQAEFEKLITRVQQTMQLCQR